MLELILSHTAKLKWFPQARPNKASGKGPCTRAVDCPEKKNRKHMWRAAGRDVRLTDQQGTRIPGLRPDLTLLVPTDNSFSATLGQRSRLRYQCWAQLREAGCMGTEQRMEGVRERAMMFWPVGDVMLPYSALHYSPTLELFHICNQLEFSTKCTVLKGSKYI